MKRMRIWGVQFDRAQRGWICSLTFTYTSAKQFTDVTECIQAGAKLWLWAFVRARRAATTFVKEHGAKRGERESLGWAAVAMLAICLLGSSARADQPQFFLRPDGSVEQRVAKVESDVSRLEARIADLERQLGAVAAKPKSATVAASATCPTGPCGDNCGCASVASAPASGHWERQKVGLFRSRDVWVQDAAPSIASPPVTYSVGNPFSGSCPNGQCPTTTRRR